MTKKEQPGMRITSEMIEQDIRQLARRLADHPIAPMNSYLPISAMTPIAPMQSVQVTARPQVPFRGTRLCVFAQHASSFIINDVYVGMKAVSVQAGEIPAEPFATKLDLLAKLDAELLKDGVVRIVVDDKVQPYLGMPLTLPLAPVGTDVRIVATNIGDKAMPFYAAFFGESTY